MIIIFNFIGVLLMIEIGAKSDTSIELEIAEFIKTQK